MLCRLLDRLTGALGTALIALNAQSWVWLYTTLSVSFKINWRLLTGLRFGREAL